MNTLFIGRKTIHLSQVDSTNRYTNELLQQSVVSEGTIVIAQSQLSGRGQRGKNWQSEPGKNLTLSLVLYPAFLAINEQFRLNQAVSLGIRDFVLLHIKKQVSVKWSNDIYIEDEKVAGILIENSIRADKIINSVIGIGLNVNQLEFSKDIQNPTSLKLHTKVEYNLNECLEQLCECLEMRYLQMKSSPVRIEEDYRKALYRLNCWHDYVLAGKKVKAKIKGVTPQGLLLFERDDKEESAYDFREVEFIH